MSDVSFDTSAADTLTSGLSLGQYIKNVAEEAQPSDRWFPLQPTVEKEWHTLQGEPISENTIVDDEMIELPLSDISTSSTKQEFLNPVASLIKHSENQKQSETSKQGSKSIRQLSPSLATPAVTSQPSKQFDNYPRDYFATPALSYQRKQGAKKYSFATTPLTTKHHQIGCSKTNDTQLSTQDISSLLEKDDSLAQRVKDLLEDDGSSKSESNEIRSKPQNDQQIPTLLQSTSRENKKSIETQYSTSTTASERDEHIVLSDVSVCSTNEKPTPSTVLNQSNPMMKTLNLFNESGFDLGNLTGISNLGDPLESLNASAGTEYGDLPETVDIPKDIVHRLNNMRLISQQQQTRFDASSNLTSSLSNDNSAYVPAPSGVTAHSAMPPVAVTSSTKPVPISGDVRFYTGSNPTTPQFPIEEEKLKQLQTYIEKKTGVPTVSPLVVGGGSVTKPSAAPMQFSEATPVTVGVSTVVSSAGTSALLAATPFTRLELDSVRFESCKQGDMTPKPPVNPLQFDSSQRCDPEGMSPPMNSSTAPLATTKTAVQSAVTSSTPATNQSAVVTIEDESKLSENLSDESLLARIKSALSDSYSQNPDQFEKSGASLTSSVDSLAAHVKALLKEEVPRLVPDVDHETSNLSEAIENFEHTELWKFVAQFLPSSVPSQLAGSLPLTNVSSSSHFPPGETVEQDAPTTESFADNSVLDRIRAELRKSSFREELSEKSSSTSQSEKLESIGDPKRHTTEISENESYHPAITKPPEVRTFSSTKQAVTTPAESKLHIIDEEPLLLDPIPGIPDFTPSVLRQSSPTEPFLGQNSTQARSTATHQTKTAWPEKKFSHYKQNAKTMITNQLNRAAHRDFDISLTPAKHSAVFLSDRPPASKMDNYVASSTKRDASVSTADRRSPPQSAYFKKQDVSFTSSSTTTENRTYDVARSSRTTPSSNAERQGQVESILSRKTTPLTKSTTELTPLTSAMSNKSTSVTPMVSSGLPSPSKRVTLKEPQRSAPSRYQHPYNSFERSRSGSPARSARSRSVEFASPKRRKSPLRDRLTVQDWLKSPERKQKLVEQKYLPTFDELMEEERRELDEKALKERELQAEKEMRSLQERDLNAQSSRKSHSALRDSHGSYFDRQGKKLDFEKSSLHPQLDDNDSYQQASLNTGGIPTAFSRSSLPSEDSDVNIQRRIVNQTASDTDFKPELRKIPRTVSEFQSMDEKSQQEFLRQVMVWMNRKKRASTSGEKSRPDSAPTTSISRSESLVSNNAVCDSDSTEYCDLPSTRPATANTFNTSSLLSMDEAKAEKLMRKLLERIKRQKESERPERKRTSHKRTAASSSTPQKRRPPLPVPEASSIASTDTDVGGKYYIQVRDRKHPGHRKVAYVEEVSESEPAAFVRIKRKSKKSEPLPERIVLHDRSVQTESSVETARSHLTIVEEKSPRKLDKKSKAIQTSTNIKEKVDVQDKENIVTGIRRKPSQHQQRFSNFFVDFKNGEKLTKRSQPRECRPAHRSVAWYEPYSYQPYWMNRDDNERQTHTKGLVQLTLQEALANQHPEFISKSRERQRRITIHSDERRLQEIWEEERQRVFGKRSEAKPKRSVTSLPQRRSLQLTRKQIVAETREKYEQLPEVVKRREEERRKREYASYRLKAQNYKKKIQNKVLGRYFA